MHRLTPLARNPGCTAKRRPASPHVTLAKPSPEAKNDPCSLGPLPLFPPPTPHQAAQDSSTGSRFGVLATTSEPAVAGRLRLSGRKETSALGTPGPLQLGSAASLERTISGATEGRFPGSRGLPGVARYLGVSRTPPGPEHKMARPKALSIPGPGETALLDHGPGAAPAFAVSRAFPGRLSKLRLIGPKGGQGRRLEACRPPGPWISLALSPHVDSKPYSPVRPTLKLLVLDSCSVRLSGPPLWRLPAKLLLLLASAAST